jgi:hypothetical protein
VTRTSAVAPEASNPKSSSGSADHNAPLPTNHRPQIPVKNDGCSSLCLDGVLKASGAAKWQAR